MTDKNNTDFDLFERLCLTKTFDELSQEERQLVLGMVTEAEYKVLCEVYQTMHEQRPDEIDPPSTLKNKLDKAWEAKRHRNGIFQLHMPVYQSAAAALIFFLAGLGLNLIREKPAKVIYNTAEVIKYVDRPVKQIRYVTLPAEKEQHQSSQPQTKPIGKNIVTPETNPESIRQQAIASAEIEKSPNSSNGVSIENDTVLKKMMVTIY